MILGRKYGITFLGSVLTLSSPFLLLILIYKEDKKTELTAHDLLSSFIYIGSCLHNTAVKRHVGYRKKGKREHLKLRIVSECMTEVCVILLSLDGKWLILNDD